MRMIAAVAAALVFASCDASGGTENGPAESGNDAGANTVVGVWRYVEVGGVDSTGAEVSRPMQPGLRIFTQGGHFSNVVVTSANPREPVDSTGTPEQFYSIWQPFTGNSGTYEVSGDSIVSRYIVAKAPDFMRDGNRAVFEFRISGDTLELTSRSNVNGPTPNAPTYRLVRAE